MVVDSFEIICYFFSYFFSLNLSEENDGLKVKLSQAEATIHELKLCLEQEKEGTEMSKNKYKTYSNFISYFTKTRKYL